MSVMFESGKRDRDSRSGFERELNILKENLINRRMHFSKDAKKSTQDLVKVKYSPNQRFDLNTITEMVRILAMSVNFDREQFIPKGKNE